MSTTSIESQTSNAPAKPDWRRQFMRPTGRLGRLVGHLMAVKNRRRNDWVVSLLDVGPTDRVLELGFGPGVDLQRVAARAAKGHVAGIDHSDAMADLARRRNRAAVAEGRVEIVEGSMASLPWPDATFDTAFAINAFQFAGDPLAVVRGIARVLRPGGRLAVAVQPRNKGATAATADEVGRRLAALVIDAGLEDVRVERKELRPVPVVCVIGKKSRI